jgi:molybdate transport system permease protein
MLFVSRWAAIGLFAATFLASSPGRGSGHTGPGDATGIDTQARGDSTLLVLAAASLTDVLPRVARLWAEAGGIEVRFSFDGTSRLAPQAVQGLPADLFFSADQRWLDWVEERGGILAESRVDLLGNQLVLVVPERGTLSFSGPQDLLDPAVRHLALAGENVPAGRYGKAALEATGVWDELSPRVVRAGNVRGALEWVALGEAEAGVVYRTDAAAESRVRISFTFGPETHPPITYPAAVLARAPLPGPAREFLEFCRSPAAARVFQASGFDTFQDDRSSPTGESWSSQSAAPSGASPLPNPWSAIRLSFLVALAATLVGFVPAVWLGWVLARKDFFGKTLVSTIALVPLVLPPVVTGFILLSIFGTQSPIGAWLASLGIPIPFTLLGATLAALAVGLPLYVISVRNAFQAVDPSYEEVAQTLGQRPWSAFRRVTFPLALPGIAAGAVLAFARALGEFGATVVLAGNVEGSTRTIALAVYTLLESPQGRGAIWVLVGASVALSLGALLGFEVLSRHQRKQMGGRRGH